MTPLRWPRSMRAVRSVRVAHRPKRDANNRICAAPQTNGKCALHPGGGGSHGMNTLLPELKSITKRFEKNSRRRAKFARFLGAPLKEGNGCTRWALIWAIQPGGGGAGGRIRAAAKSTLGASQWTCTTHQRRACGAGQCIDMMTDAENAPHNCRRR